VHSKNEKYDYALSMKQPLFKSIREEVRGGFLKNRPNLLGKIRKIKATQ